MGAPGNVLSEVRMQFSLDLQHIEHSLASRRQLRQLYDGDLKLMLALVHPRINR